MSYITFNQNEIVYVRGIGYGTLLSCGNLKSISQKIDHPVNLKKESIYFDPEMFNSDDSNNSHKSQEEKKVETQSQLPEEIPIKKSEKEVKEVVVPAKIEQKQSNNIVKVRLQGTQTIVHTLDCNLTKIVFISVKPFLPIKKESCIIQIQITKTVDSLKKAIFQQLGETFNNYYNIRIFSVTPVLSELNVPSKTMSQCGIKDGGKLILTADYAFGFAEVPIQNNSKFKVTLNNGYTLISTKIIPQAKKAEPNSIIALFDQAITENPPPSNPLPSNPLPLITEIKQQESKQLAIKPVQSVQEVKKADKIQQQKKESENGPYHARCQVQFSSGKHYWEIKLEKLPAEEEDLVIGVCKPSEKILVTDCNYSWAYQVLSGKKVFAQMEKNSGTIEEEVQPYGYVCKVNDVVGVMVAFKEKVCRVTFYRNNISCRQAFQIDLEKLKIDSLTPFVNIGGDAQITLDAKAAFPLDSYRQK